MCNLNAASVRRIAGLPGVSLAQAYDLHLWAPFESWDDVAKTPGVDRVTVDALKASGAHLGAPGAGAQSPPPSSPAPADLDPMPALRTPAAGGSRR